VGFLLGIGRRWFRMAMALDRVGAESGWVRCGRWGGDGVVIGTSLEGGSAECCVFAVSFNHVLGCIFLGSEE
jgi:hypothetical protein